MSAAADMLMEVFREELREVVRQETKAAKTRMMPEKEVLEWLNIKDPRTLKTWRQEGLKCYQMNRTARFYNPQDVEDFIVARGEAY